MVPLQQTRRVGCCSLWLAFSTLPVNAAHATPQQDVLTPAGIQSTHILRLWNLTLVVCGVVFALVLLAMVVAVVRRRSRGKDYPPDLSALTAPERRVRRVILIVSGVSVVALVGLIVADVLTDRALSMLPAEDPVRIEMTGAQWWWQAVYPPADGRPGFTTANELHVPVGRAVIVSLKAGDVIHSFWVPNLHGKKDMLPGIDSTIEFRADQGGVYRGQCAQFCGAEHALMAMLVIAEPADRYATWVDQQARPAVSTDDPIALKGMQTFEQSACAGCHTVRGTSASGSIGPDLTHLMSRQTIAAGLLANTAQNLDAWIENPGALKPGTTMPAVPLSDQDRQALVKWLVTLR
jgi:cytochrome c oxidase subunit 2